ncbi:NUDIX hydrolase [Selenomonadales bacterium OttesenSCG-928-I06]|nr:NUDIX hydrolase [Selenomonadales bacterium OttesenSCG-928-I06]
MDETKKALQRNVAKLSDDQLKEKTIHSTRVYNGNIIHVKLETVILPNGKQALREIVDHKGAVAIVPITNEGNVVLVRQYRQAARKILIEIPAGKLSPKEDPNECAKRELLEETGFTAKELYKVSSVFTTPGFSNELIHIYIAKGLTMEKQQPDEDEFLDVEIYTPEEIKALIKDNTICDGKTILGLALAGIDIKV